jgi:hypothetical protein
MPTEKTYVVDRIEGELVVLVDDESDEKVNLSSWELPPVDEGAVLKAKLDNNGKPQWGSVTVLEEEAERRKNSGRERIEELKERDPGGDINL